MWLMINKRGWLTASPIINVGLQNAYGFAEAGARVEFIADGQPHDCQDDLRRHYGLEPHPGLEINLIPRFRVARMSASIPLFVYPIKKVAKLRSQGEPVNIFTRDSSMLPFLIFLKKFLGARVFLEVHHAYADAHYLRKVGHRFSRQDRKNSLLERLFVKYLDVLVCITEPQARLYRQIFPDLATVTLPLGTRVRPGLSPAEKFRQRTLIYIGLFYRSKGAQTLLSAMNLVDSDIRLLLLGAVRPGQENPLVEEINRHGLAGRVEFRTIMPPAELYRLCAQRASAGLLPLEDTHYNRALTCPAKVCDYKAFSLPVIASRLPTTEAILSEGRDALFFQPGDVDGLARAIRQLFADEDRFTALVRGAAARAQAWTWETRASRLMAAAQALPAHRSG